MAFTKIVAAGIGSTGTVTLENLVVTGSVTGAVTGNATGLSGTPNITVGTIGATSLNASGVVTATTFSGALTGNVTGNATGLSGTPNITVGNIIASNATISGNVSVAGTLTYEDVTNVDSVGLVTARTGVRIDAGGLVVVGVTTVAAGSVSAPSITPTGDSNTGIFFPSADTIAFGEGGAEALRIDSSGNVGIGTDNPDGKLTLSAASSIDMLTFKNGATTFARLGHNSSSGANVFDIRGEAIVRILSGGNNERLRITSTGNVGIGTNNPGYKLHIEGTGETALTIEGDAAPSDAGGLLILKNNNTTANSINQIQSADAGGQTTSAINFYNVDNGTNEGYMSFLTRPSGGAPTEAARFTSSGNLRFPSGQGIDFSATADGSGTMTSELLSDYEEGTWTPIIRGASTTMSSVTYVTQSGKYVKIGDLVYITFEVSWSAASGGSGDARIGGLPFSAADSFTSIYPYRFINTGVSGNDFQMRTDSNTLLAPQTVNGSSGLFLSNFTSGTFNKTISAAGCYRVT